MRDIRRKARDIFEKVELGTIGFLIVLKLAWDEVYTRYVNRHARSKPPQDPFTRQFPDLVWYDVARDDAFVADQGSASEDMVDENPVSLQQSEVDSMKVNGQEHTFRFANLKRAEIRARINGDRALNRQGGLNWTRAEYIAYALARAPMVFRDETNLEQKAWEYIAFALGMAGAEEARRQARFLRHEAYSNDNVPHFEVARVLWRSGLVEVDGVGRERGSDGSFTPVPDALYHFVAKLAPWTPKPPRGSGSRRAA